MCDSAVPVIAFAREMNTVVHPLATHARWDHVDVNVGSLRMGRLGAVAVITVGEGLSRGSMTKRSGLDFGSVVVVVVAAQYTRALSDGERHVWTWCRELKGYLCWAKIDIGSAQENPVVVPIKWCLWTAQGALWREMERVMMYVVVGIGDAWDYGSLLSAWWWIGLRFLDDFEKKTLKTHEFGSKKPIASLVVHLTWRVMISVAYLALFRAVGLDWFLFLRMGCYKTKSKLWLVGSSWESCRWWFFPPTAAEVYSGPKKNLQLSTIFIYLFIFFF
jgi:hypothetical protein